LNRIKSLLFLLTLVISTTLLLCTDKPTEPGTHPQADYNGLYGKLVNSHGTPVAGASVKAIGNGSESLNKTARRAAAKSSGTTDSVLTDDSGYYSFESLEEGTYMLQGDYDNGSLVVLITGIRYDSAGAVLEVNTDTLRAPGRIAGRVNTGTDDDGGVVCYIPGTSYLAMTDDSGGYTLSDIPQGEYTISYRKDKLKTVNDTAVEVRSGERTTVPLRDMEADPEYPPPVPGGLTVTYDTLRGCAVLTWNPVAVEDLAGYVIYRNDTASSVPERINGKPVKDTIFIDTVFSELSDETDYVLTYRIKAQDEDANMSTVYSKAITIDAPSPTKVRTFISFKLLNTRNDTASINDTVGIIVSWNNATREHIRLEWFAGTKDSLVKEVEDVPGSGEDTLWCSWAEESVDTMLVALTDDNYDVWWERVAVNIVQDVPMAEAGKDTVIYPGDTAHLHGMATKKFGEIAKWEWKIGSGSWRETSGPDTFFMVPLEENTVICSLMVTDDDGNRVTDAVRIRPLPLVKSMAAGYNVSMILTTDTTLWACGNNDYGQFGDGTTTNKSTPVQILDDVQSIAVGGDWDHNQSMILKNDGTVWACGSNKYGQLGDGTTTDRTTRVQVMSDVQSISAGRDHSLILKTDNTLWACGYNEYGQLGDGTGTNQATSVKVMDNVKSISAGYHHSLILKVDGTLWACGDNRVCQFGDGTKVGRYAPVQVMSDVQSISAGGLHSLILKTDGTLWACGANDYGQLGDGTTTDYRIAPVQMMINVQNIAAGAAHSLILKTDNTLWACGWNEFGQLGDGTITIQPTPVQVMSGVKSMSAGGQHSLILKIDGTLWACGNNDNGQLGDGTTENHATPVQIILPAIQQ